MPWYRLYRLDPHTGHIDRAEDLFAANDVAAAHELQQRQSIQPLELWRGGRKVVRLDAVPEAAALAPRARREPQSCRAVSAHERRSSWLTT